MTVSKTQLFLVASSSWALGSCTGPSETSLAPTAQAAQTQVAEPTEDLGPVLAEEADASRAQEGGEFYLANACAECHVKGDDSFAPSLQGLGADLLLMALDGSLPHSGGTVEGVTSSNTQDLAAYLSTLN